MGTERYLTVIALTKYIKRKFDKDPHLQNVFVKGEISNFKQHSSGHMYFTLKDEKARILAVMFSRYNQNMKFQPENGMKVLIKGDLTVYEQSGQYQIYIKEMQPDGIGELYLAYEQLKEKLETEGLFSPKAKQDIPKYPECVGVITSPTGAAVRDIITTIRRRYPIAKIIVYPALVQGNQAAPSIVNCIKQANADGQADVLIAGRGGGSIEELWAFNEEIVARAIYKSELPIISAVGHETDFTIADFVADLRAPTPTGAAELAVPHIDELAERIWNRQSRLIRTMRESMSRQNIRLTRIRKSYAFRNPQKLYEQKLEQVDKYAEQLKRGAEKLFLIKQEEQKLLLKRLDRARPQELLQEAKQRYENSNKYLTRNMTAILHSKQKDFKHILSSLEAMSPLKIMDRGYSLVYSENGELAKSVKAVNVNDKVKIQFSDGSAECTVVDTEGKSI
ncbi:exodeoxyribonuclease VII large subunit [Cytobacillus gottheilii]|uniref:exodeoxyribonuclease VII large subunit n=1 Tax=Cytobacillus gottheilii TaxID=859144 RepID=UPI00082D8B2A|nr:exodeoxyribonuclease VII large subunit [Cytobacillus gottheilii]